MTLLPILLGLASATTPSFSPEQETIDQARFTACEQMVAEEERKSGASGTVTGWEECLKRLELEDPIRPAVEEQLSLARLERDHAQLKENDPAGYAKVLLATVAQYPTVQYPIDEIRLQWGSLVADTEFRQNLDGARSVAVRLYPMNGVSEDELEALGNQVRRYIYEAGFKTPDPTSADAASADIFINIEPNLETLDPLGARASVILYAERSSLKTSSVKFKTRDVRAQGIEVSVETSDIDAAKARELGIDAAAKDFADEFLLRVIHEIFADFDVSTLQ